MRYLYLHLKQLKLHSNANAGCEALKSIPLPSGITLNLLLLHVMFIP